LVSELTPAAATTAAAAELTTAAAATAAAAAATTTTEVATGTIFLGTSFVHGESATIKFLAIEIGNGFVGLILGTHFNERKTTGLVGELVHDQFAPRHGPRLLEKLEEVAFGGVE